MATSAIPPRKSLGTLLAIMIVGWTSSGVACAQTPPGFPGWVDDLGPRGAIRSYLPPEYDGPAPGFAKAFIKEVTPRCVAKSWKLQGSAFSGILAFWDRRNAPAAKTGIDTGLSRVYGIHWLATAAPGKHELLITGWDADSRRPVAKMLTIPAAGPVTVRDFGPPGPVGQIWVHGALVHGMLYVFDLQNLTVRRRKDSDGDGVPETLDPGFAFSLDPSTSPMPFSAFGPTSSGIVALLGRPLTRVLKETPSGLVLEAVSDPDPVPVPRITGPLYVTQRRVRARGRPGAEYRIREKTGGVPSPGWISPRFTLPRGGHALIDLDVSLQADWELEIVSIDSRESPGPRAKVANRKLAALFEPLDRDCNQGTVMGFEGDGFRKTHQARCRLDGRTVALATRFVSPTRIEITLPTRGDTSKSPPYDGAQTVLLWLVDTERGAAASDKIYVKLLFAP